MMLPLSLKEVAGFIAKNGHLEGTPSAKEVEKSGVDLAEMNEALLRKIEEQTLYLIEQDKLLTEYRSRLDHLEQKTSTMNE